MVKEVDKNGDGEVNLIKIKVEREIIFFYWKMNTYKRVNYSNKILLIVFF